MKKLDVLLFIGLALIIYLLAGCKSKECPYVEATVIGQRDVGAWSCFSRSAVTLQYKDGVVSSYMCLIAERGDVVKVRRCD